ITDGDPTYAGDAASTFTFGSTNNGGSPSPAPLVITSETSTPTIYSCCGSNSSYFPGTTGLALSSSFPKGVAGFHLMKYEITEELYAAFLNTLPSLWQSFYFPSHFGDSRNELDNSGVTSDIYVTNFPDRAQNFISWKMASGFADWAGLAPMTELQYEKACRG